MISGDAAEREEREDERESDKPNGAQPAPDKIEKAPSGAISPKLARRRVPPKISVCPLNKSTSTSSRKAMHCIIIIPIEIYKCPAQTRKKRQLHMMKAKNARTANFFNNSSVGQW